MPPGLRDCRIERVRGRNDPTRNSCSSVHDRHQVLSGWHQQQVEIERIMAQVCSKPRSAHQDSPSGARDDIRVRFVRDHADAK